jgi:cyclopropane-fatty-acyl-phospholipid synthase
MVQEKLKLDLAPDWLIRIGIRRLLRQRLREEESRDAEKLIAELRTSPIAINTRDANRQHYEVPAAFYGLVLGKHRKYSCCYWPEGTTSLESAEEQMLDLTAERAGLADGQSILELGCGWGSLSLYIAKRFPGARITAVSNSHSQREYIEGQARARGLTNLRIITCDMNEFSIEGSFDRVVSVEMFEHMRNYEELLRRIASWLKADGKLFVHIFSHARFSYPFEVRDASDWMAEHFFTGGIMPADELLSHFDRDMRIVEHWKVDGVHYQKTAEAWLENMDRARAEVMPVLAGAYGAGEASKWFWRWRVFFMACAELWGYKQGSEWIVSHYLFEKSEPRMPGRLIYK